MLDIMQISELGIILHLVANIMYTFSYMDEAPTPPAAAMDQLWVQLQEIYAELGLKRKHSSLTVKNICDPDKHLQDYPVLKKWKAAPLKPRHEATGELVTLVFLAYICIAAVGDAGFCPGRTRVVDEHADTPHLGVLLCQQANKIVLGRFRDRDHSSGSGLWASNILVTRSGISHSDKHLRADRHARVAGHHRATARHGERQRPFSVSSPSRPRV